MDARDLQNQKISRSIPAIIPALTRRNIAQADERPRGLLAALHVRQQIGTAGDEHGFPRGRRREQIGCLADASWRLESEIAERLRLLPLPCGERVG